MRSFYATIVFLLIVFICKISELKQRRSKLKKERQNKFVERTKVTLLLALPVCCSFFLPIEYAKNYFEFCPLSLTRYGYLCDPFLTDTSYISNT